MPASWVGIGRDQRVNRINNSLILWALWRALIPPCSHEPRVFRIRIQAMRLPDGMGCSPRSSEMNPLAS